jgi:hypothetical protein
METIRRLGILAALGVLIFVFAPSAAQAAVMSKVQPFANLAAATQGKSMVEQTQYRRGPRCRTVYTAMRPLGLAAGDPVLSCAAPDLPLVKALADLDVIGGGPRSQGPPFVYWPGAVSIRSRVAERSNAFPS